MAKKAKIPCKTKQYPFVIHAGNSDNAITVNDEGYVFIDKIAILDQKSGKYWDLTIEDGKINLEPHGIENKRDFRIDKVLKNKKVS